jgi:hypothetical protein
MTFCRIYVLEGETDIVGGTSGEYANVDAALAAARIRLQPGQQAEVITEAGRVYHVMAPEAEGKNVLF